MNRLADRLNRFLAHASDLQVALACLAVLLALGFILPTAMHIAFGF